MITSSSPLAICVAGIPGVGKTTLLRAAVENRMDAEHVVGSSVLRQTIAPATTTEFDRWPPVRRDQARARAIASLQQLRTACPGLLLVDGHFSLRERDTNRLHRVFTREDMAFYDALVLLDAPTQQVLAWRANDPRRRPAESADQIDAHRRFERQQGTAIAESMRVPFLIVDTTNPEERLVALHHFLDHLRAPP